ncbi:MAG: DUF2974 domain-containing protein [Lachnospiraceae bacterium]|jgi:hypothetical protein|nr:DUF2974 domain-containing protein [Lachnospiraceae bacterium]
MTNNLSESETSLLLDTFMYLNYYDAAEGQKLSDILLDLSHQQDYQRAGAYYEEYAILEAAVAENPGFGELTIGIQSVNMGFDSGTSACLFQEPGAGTIYVVYRGTGDGEWLDNGRGLTMETTIQQERALTYFEQAMEQGGFTEAQRIIITGHSKGGNKAQFVTMESDARYAALIDRCISVDGQGFSNEAVVRWQQGLGVAEYQTRTGKLYGINGENDFISGLGNTIIPREQIRFLHTPVERGNVAGYHDIKYLFASRDGQGAIVFGGASNRVVSGQKEWGRLATELSTRVMAMPLEERAGCAAAIMQIMELGGEQKSGINGEKVTLTDLWHLLMTGLPTVFATLINSTEGEELIDSIIGKGGQNGCVFAVNLSGLLNQAGALMRIAAQLDSVALEVKAVAVQLRTSLQIGVSDNSWLLTTKINRECDRIHNDAAGMNRLAGVLEQAVKIYSFGEQTIASVGEQTIASI